MSQNYQIEADEDDDEEYLDDDFDETSPRVTEQKVTLNALSPAPNSSIPVESSQHRSSGGIGAAAIAVTPSQ